MSDDDGFARLLRGWRGRVEPVEADARRRTPGLRREELAVAAGVSADYIVQLEQGRAQRPSAAVVAALARALRLAPHETHAFFHAAGLAEQQTPIDRTLDPRLRRFLDRVGDVAVAVYSADWWLLGWNPLWAELLGDPADAEGLDTNLVRQVFSRDDWRPVPRDRSLDDFRQSLVDDLRTAFVEHALDDRLADLVQRLIDERPAFAEAWDRALAGRHDAERKTVRHPAGGELLLDADTFQFRDTDQHLVIYSAAPGSADEAALGALPRA